jgi:dihydropyrimidinase
MAAMTKSTPRSPCTIFQPVDDTKIAANSFTPANSANLQIDKLAKGPLEFLAHADLVIWDPKRKVTLADGLLHDRTGYTPYAGRTITGWPETVLRRGEVIVRAGKLAAKPGSGAFLPRAGGAAAAPLNRLTADMDPARNFGARLY